MKNNPNIIQRSDEWHHLRKGKITGTLLKAIMGSPKMRQDAMYEVIAGRLTVGIGDPDENAMDRGVRLESDALAEFELETGVEVESTGFSESEDNPFIANSPDGWIKEKDGVNFTQGVEIKCMGGKNHVKLWLTDKIPDDYFWQVIQYFVVNEKLELLYFVGYNPDIPVHPLHIIEVKKSDIKEDLKVARMTQDSFLKEVEAILSTLIKEI